MKVKCVRLLDSPGIQSHWLLEGKSYDVLSIVMDAHGRWLLRILCESSPGVALFQLEQFEIVDASVPHCWIATWNASGVFELTIREWAHPGFWESYFDGELDAKKLFECGVQKISSQISPSEPGCKGAELENGEPSI
jgi:hypothetical protein